MTDTDQKSQGGPIALILFLVIVGVLCLCTEPGIGKVSGVVDEHLTRMGMIKSLLVAGIYGLGALAMGLLLASRRTLVRRLTQVFALLTVALERGMESINGYGYGLWEAKLFRMESAVADDAITTFGSQFALPLGVSLIGLVTVEIFRRVFRLAIKSRWGLIAGVLGLAATYAILAKTDGGSAVFPPPLKVPAVTALAWSPQSIAPGRSAPNIEADQEPFASHIIFIVDESVRGDVLSMNGGRSETTPGLAKLKDYLNFGICSSATNSSAPSNIVLQSGATLEVLMQNPGRSETDPNVFQFAQHAGFRTALLAGQKIISWYYLSPFDLDAIDHYRLYDESERGLADHEIDMAMIGEVGDIVSQPGPSFSYLLKQGAHFPYDQKHPKDRLAIATRDGLAGTNDKERERWRHYLNAVAWTTDEFLVRLLKELEGQDALVIYTSDHGQSIYEGGIEGSHGVYLNPPRSQANVPLLVFATNPKKRRALMELGAQAAHDNHDRVSHFEIFPTLMEMLGYERGRVEDRYGPGIFRALPKRQRRFFSGDPFKESTRFTNDFDVK